MRLPDDSAHRWLHIPATCLPVMAGITGSPVNEVLGQMQPVLAGKIVDPGELALVGRDDSEGERGPR